MLPSPEYFSEYVSQLGINNDDHIIVYTKPDCFSASRVWWTFKVFGHSKVSILNGGINSYKALNGSLEVGVLSKITPTTYVASSFQSNLIVNKEEVLDIVNNGSKQILDARSNARFKAEDPEPRAGLEGGHIPGSLNLPFLLLLQPNDPTMFKTPEEIRDILIESGYIMGSKVILTCGSGVTAAVLAVGLNLIGKELDISAIYDGSWSEWGSFPELPKSK